MTDERGWALVSVLCVVSMLALMAAATMELTLTSSRLERASADKTEIDADFDAGLARAFEGIRDSRMSERWRVDSVAKDFSFDGAGMHIAVQDESGRFDLNNADGSMIRRVFEGAGLDLDTASTLTDRVLDWRDASGLVRLHGASDADYAAKGFAWRPRHGAFQSVDELKLVMGMTPAIFEKVRGAFTVYTKRPAINPAIASPEALRALYLDNPEEADDMLRKRDEAASNGTPTDVLNPDMPGYGSAYTVAIDLEKYGRKSHREYVMMITGDDKRPWLLLAYR